MSSYNIANTYWLHLEIVSKKTMQRWNKALSLVAGSHVTSFNQLDCYISAKCDYAMLKFVYNIDTLGREEIYPFLNVNIDLRTSCFRGWNQASAFNNIFVNSDVAVTGSFKSLISIFRSYSVNKNAQGIFQNGK